MAYSGRFQPKNPRKYKGDHRKITWRSSWELAFMRWCDGNPEVVEWSSEEVVIPYISTAQGNKRRRYFMDAWVKFSDGQQFLFEIKPKAECSPPTGKKQTKRLMEKQQTFQINVDKWRAAREYARQRGWTFKILHEDNLRKMGIRVT